MASTLLHGPLGHPRDGSEILACLDADPRLSAIPVVTVRRSGGAGVRQIVYRLHVRD